MIIEEIFTSTSDEENDVCKTEGGVLFTHCSILGKVSNRKQSEYKNDKQVAPSFLLSTLFGIHTQKLRCSPYYYDNDMWEQISLLNDEDIVHLDGKLSFYKVESQVNQPMIIKQFTIENMRKINVDINKYVSIWFCKLLNARNNEPIPIDSELYESFIVNCKNINIKTDSDYFYFSSPNNKIMSSLFDVKVDEKKESESKPNKLSNENIEDTSKIDSLLSKYQEEAKIEAKKLSKDQVFSNIPKRRRNIDEKESVEENINKSKPKSEPKSKPKSESKSKSESQIKSKPEEKKKNNDEKEITQENIQEILKNYPDGLNLDAIIALLNISSKDGKKIVYNLLVSMKKKNEMITKHGNDGKTILWAIP